MSEQDWNQGYKAAWRSMLEQACRNLGVDDPEAGKARWISERESAIAVLRQVCEHHGDNDWDDTLNLYDIIEKHLHKHLS